MKYMPKWLPTILFFLNTIFLLWGLYGLGNQLYFWSTESPLKNGGYVLYYIPGSLAISFLSGYMVFTSIKFKSKYIRPWSIKDYIVNSIFYSFLTGVVLTTMLLQFASAGKGIFPKFTFISFFMGLLTLSALSYLSLLYSLKILKKIKEQAKSFIE